MKSSLLVTSLMVALGASAALAGCKKPEEKPATPTTEAAPQPPPADAAAPTPPPADAAPPPVDAAPAAPADPLKTVCPQVLAKIVECAEDKEFAKALKEGASAKDEKTISKLIKGIGEWPSPPCGSLAAAYEYDGFLDRWAELADPAILESCAKLGAAVKAAGGLFGGDSDR